MNVAILIPARFQSSRFPGKSLVELRGATGVAKPLIQRSFDAACRVRGIAGVHVLTDDSRIAEAASGFGAPVIMTSPDCRNGTERCAEAVRELGEIDLVVNFQGDALLTPPAYVEALIDRMQANSDCDVATAAIQLRSSEARALMEEERAGRVGGTTVVADATGRALYFSKRLIPYVPPEALQSELSPLRLHVGVYAYRPSALTRYAATPPSELEALEGLEQLRFLTSGVPVAIVDLEPPPFELRELNNPEDIVPVERAVAAAGLE